MPLRFYTKAFLLLVAVISIAGCASLKREAEAIKPTAKLVGTRLAGLNFEQADLVFDVDITNRNPFSLNLAGLDYNLKIDNHSLISGVTGQGIKVKRSSTSRVALPVSLKFDDLRKIPGELWRNDQFGYQLDTSVKLDLPIIGSYAIPFSTQGELPVPKAPRIRLGNIKITDLSLTSALIVAEISIDNPNGFDLGLSNFNYRLNINRQSWGEGVASMPGNIPRKGNGIIRLPFKLDLANMGKAVYDLLNGGQQLNYQLVGGITLDTGFDFLRQYRMPLNISGTTSF